MNLLLNWTNVNSVINRRTLDRYNRTGIESVLNANQPLRLQANPNRDPALLTHVVSFYHDATRGPMFVAFQNLDLVKNFSLLKDVFHSLGFPIA